MEKKVEISITEFLKDQIPGLIAIYIFGSMADNSTTPESDIDIAFLTFRKISAVEKWKIQEELASKFLSEKGFQIICSNWHYGKGEIDIVAEKDNTMVFVEVKTRESNIFGEPETFVTRKKQRQVIKTADAYIQMKNIALESRFDVISVILGKNKFEIHHIEDAFYPIA